MGGMGMRGPDSRSVQTHPIQIHPIRLHPEKRALVLSSPLSPMYRQTQMTGTFPPLLLSPPPPIAPRTAAAAAILTLARIKPLLGALLGARTGRRRRVWG